jgi:hypothetical protein
MLRFTVRVTHADLLPPDNVLAEAGARGVSNLIVRHLRARPANRRGFPSSGYWADAADSVSVKPGSGKSAAVEISKEGVALHYEGGIVRPDAGGKALAIPLAAQVYGKNPSEWSGFQRGDEADSDDILQMFWPKNSPHGFLKERDSGELLYLLVPRATIRADRSVLPTDDQLLAAAEDAIMEACA